MAEKDNDMDQGKISQDEIQRYRNGSMGSAERHALERRALSDPFLADALQGSEQITAEEFSEDILNLNNRVASRKSKDWLTPVRLAAGIAIIAGAGSLIFFLNNNEPKQLALEMVSPVAEPIPHHEDSSNTMLSLAEPAAPATKSLPDSDQPITSEKKDTKIPETSQSISGAGQQGATSPLAQGDAPPKETEILSDETVELKKEAPEPAAATAPQRSAADRKAARSNSTLTPSPYRIGGHIASSENGLPLPGVNVIIKDTNLGTITDEAGNFQLLINIKNPNLIFSCIGFGTKEINPGDESPLTIIMAPDPSTSSEVAVTAYGISNPNTADRDMPYEFASPAGGRSAFQKYLESSIQYPEQALINKTEGKVTVQFTVTANGSLTDFTVIRGIGNGCEEELIRLIKNGPKWSPSHHGPEPVEDMVRVRLRFSLPH